jgi:hypothetical protein
MLYISSHFAPTPSNRVTPVSHPQEQRPLIGDHLDALALLDASGERQMP